MSITSPHLLRATNRQIEVTRMEFNLPIEIKKEFEDLLKDHRGRKVHGAASQVVTGLIDGWIKRQRRERSKAATRVY